MTPDSIRYETSTQLARRIARRSAYTFTEVNAVRMRQVSEGHRKRVMLAIYHRLRVSETAPVTP